jgi:hypothetical protein
MVEYVGHTAARRGAWEKARQASSALVESGLEQVEAAVWLVAGQRFSQAVTAVHAAIELLLKAALETVHPILIAEQIDYRLLKSLLKDAVEGIPQLQSEDARTAEFKSTIGFWEAFERAKDFYPQLRASQADLQRLQAARNGIVHRRADLSDDELVRLIFGIAMPFLEAFTLSSTGIELEKLLGPNIYREIRVACEVCASLEDSGKTGYAYVVKTIQTAIFYRDVDFPAPIDEDGWALDEGNREFHIGRSLKGELERQCSGIVIDIMCKICGSAYAYAEIDHFDGDAVDCAPHSVACSRCGLWVVRSDTGLAAAHFGTVTAAEIEEALEGS